MASSSGSGGSSNSSSGGSSSGGSSSGGSGSGGSDKSSDKNPIVGRPIDHGFYEALWELIYQALGINIQQNRIPDQDAGFLKKPPPHSKTLQLVLEATAAKAKSPAQRRKKRLQEFGTLVRNVPAKKARKVEGNQELGRVYAATMRRVLLREVHGYLDSLLGVDESPPDPARRNLREYLEFMIQQVELDIEVVGPVRRPLPLAPPVTQSYFRVAARAVRPDQLDPPPELEEYLQELVIRELWNLLHAQELHAMYSDDSDCGDDSDDADDSGDPDDGGDGAGSSMGVQA